MKSADARSGRRANLGALKWWHGMAAGIVLMMSPGAALLLIVLAAPAALVVAVDITPGRGLSRTVVLFLLAGIIGPMREFLGSGHDLAAAFQTLGQPAIVLFTWLLGVGGWLVTETFSVIADFVTNQRHAAESRAVQAQLLKLSTEWEISAA